MKVYLIVIFVVFFFCVFREIFCVIGSVLEKVSVDMKELAKLEI